MKKEQRKYCCYDKILTYTMCNVILAQWNVFDTLYIEQMILKVNTIKH